MRQGQGTEGRFRVKRPAGAVLLVLLASSLFAAGTPQQGVPTSLQGTIVGVQPTEGSLDVVTGVGMALRQVRLTIPATAGITGGTAAPLSTFKRGDIVRVQCHWSGKRLVTDRIEKVVPQ